MKRSFNLLLTTALLLLLAVPQIGRGDGGPEHQDRQSRPIELGVSGGNVNDRSRFVCCSGTLGSLITKNNKLYILSNNHVLARTNRGIIGEDVNNPGNIDVGCQIISQDAVADLSEFVPLNTSNNTVDAAIAEIRSGQIRTDGSILDIGAPSSSTVEPSIGLSVKKSGRTTGLTIGQIAAINVTIDVSYSRKCGSFRTVIARFFNQIRITPENFSTGGDSGSLIVENVSISPRTVGLLFAGSSTDTFANPINAVLSAFGVTIVGSASSAAEKQSTHEELTMNNPEVVAATAVQERYQDALMEIPGVAGVGTGQSEETAQPIVEVYLEQATIELEQTIPQALESIPVKIVVTGPVEARNCPVSSPAE